MTPETSDSINATCPFCGLLCDDLIVRSKNGRLRVLENGCPISIPAFESLDPDPNASPRVDGKPASFDDAVMRAAMILREARQPLIGGLATDLSGMRAIMALADRCGAAVDHMNSAANFRNLLVLQDSGWVTTTFAEIKNHADLLLVIGTDVVSRFPRFFERLIWPRDAMFVASPRQVIYLGDVANVNGATSPAGVQATLIRCDNRDLGEVIGALRCLLDGRPLQTNEIGGVPLATLAALAEKIRSARYGVATWAAPDLDFAHAELTVQRLCELIKDLNRTSRFCGLPLGGSEGDSTANQVCTWQSGFPLRTNFNAGFPHYDPWHHLSARMLAGNEADALLWVTSYDAARLPPATEVPTVVLGRVGTSFKREPEVYIPIATPGVDHAGHLFRGDNVVSLPLHKLRESALPSVAETVAAIERGLMSTC